MKRSVVIPPGVCLCGAGGCQTPEAVALRRQLEAERAAERAVNAAAVDAYCADRDAGIQTLRPSEYVAIAWGRTDPHDRLKRDRLGEFDNSVG